MLRRHPDNISFARLTKIARVPEACLALFYHLRFPDGLTCPWCGVCEPNSRFARHRSRPGLYTCGACQKQFTLTSGTAMHRTKVPLGQWLRAIWLMVSSSKGISATKLGEMLDITYKVAWHLGHRIRAMMAEERSSLAPRAAAWNSTRSMPGRLPGLGTGLRELRHRSLMRPSAAARLGPSC